MEKTVRMTTEEINRNYGAGEAQAIAMAKAAKEEDVDPNPGGRAIATGFAAFQEYINQKGRPPVSDRKVKISIWLPESAVTRLREVDGYTTLLGDYIMCGLASGALHISSKPRK